MRRSAVKRAAFKKFHETPMHRRISAGERKLRKPESSMDNHYSSYPQAIAMRVAIFKKASQTKPRFLI